MTVYTRDAKLFFFFFQLLYLIFQFEADLNQILFPFHATLGPSLQLMTNWGSLNQEGGAGECSCSLQLCRVKIRMLLCAVLRTQLTSGGKVNMVLLTLAAEGAQCLPCLA